MHADGVLEGMENLKARRGGSPLVQGNRGGSNGGQTVLTPEGKEFLKRYRKFEQEVRAGADASFQKWFGTEEK